MNSISDLWFVEGNDCTKGVSQLPTAVSFGVTGEASDNMSSKMEGANEGSAGSGDINRDG